MARRTNADKGKESLELMGVKVDPALKKAIEEEGNALGVAMGTYARQLLITGWQSRHEAPIAKNPREQRLTGWFNELPIGEQDSVLTMVEALYKKHSSSEPARIIRPESHEDIQRLAEELNDGGPLVKKARKDQPMRRSDPSIEGLRPFKPKKGKKD